MYHAFVRRSMLRTFREDLPRGNWAAVVRRTAPDVEHTFPGEGALAGTRHSRAALQEWFERLGRLIPEMRFAVDEAIVSGPPWRTRVAIRWRNWGATADGEPYANSGCEVFEIRWGRATRIHQYLDTGVVRDHLARMAANGIEEAAAAPVAAATVPG